MRRLVTVMTRVTMSTVVGVALCWTAPDPSALREDIADPERWVRRDGVDGVLAQVAGAAGWLLLLWSAIGLSVTAAAALPGIAGRIGSAIAGRTVPVAVRRVAAVALGLSLAGQSGTALAAAPSAGAAAVPVPGAAAHPTSDDVDWPLPEPPRAAAVDWPLPRTAPPAGPTRPEHVVVVRPGDTLWSIAAARLEPGASTAEIAAEWPRWYAANRRTVGPDPAHLEVGVRLRPPRGR